MCESVSDRQASRFQTAAIPNDAEIATLDGDRNDRQGETRWTPRTHRHQCRNPLHGVAHEAGRQAEYAEGHG
jgi:hypothetical protein